MFLEKDQLSLGNGWSLICGDDEFLLVNERPTFTDLNESKKALTLPFILLIGQVQLRALLSNHLPQPPTGGPPPPLGITVTVPAPTPERELEPNPRPLLPNPLAGMPYYRN